VFRVKLQQLVQLSSSELLLFFVCLVGLVPAAVHVAVMFIYTVQSNICLYDVHSQQQQPRFIDGGV